MDPGLDAPAKNYGKNWVLGPGIWTWPKILGHQIPGPGTQLFSHFLAWLVSITSENLNQARKCEKSWVLGPGIWAGSRTLGHQIPGPSTQLFSHILAGASNPGSKVSFSLKRELKHGKYFSGNLWQDTSRVSNTCQACSSKKEYFSNYCLEFPIHSQKLIPLAWS